jgi:putative copper resistance protein D
MDWFGARVDGPLVVIRAIHFSATAIIAGSLIFRAVVAEPALGSTKVATAVVRSQILLTAWIGLAIAAASGVIWLQLQAVSMSGLPLGEAMTSEVLSTVLNETQFGSISEIRLVLAVILAGCLAYDRLALSNWLGLGSALGLIAAIAWTGHAGATLGETGNLHLTADVLHLIAAAAWLGGLVSLALLLAAARRHQAVAWASLARDVAQRFSTLGIISVGALLVTGIVNAWILVGSFHALLVTEYGQLLMLKIVVFAIMLVFAAVNRFWLTPQLVLAPESEQQLNSLRQLTRNSTIEIVLGLTIYGIVGVLGTLHPAIHLL